MGGERYEWLLLSTWSVQKNVLWRWTVSFTCCALFFMMIFIDALLSVNEQVVLPFVLANLPKMRQKSSRELSKNTVP
jgi:hypothetical protein